MKLALPLTEGSSLRYYFKIIHLILLYVTVKFPQISLTVPLSLPEFKLQRAEVSNKSLAFVLRPNSHLIERLCKFRSTRNE